MIKNQTLIKCGPITAFLMFFFGLGFGLVGVLFSHLAISFYKYHFAFLFPIIVGFFIGKGISAGIRIGRCGRQWSGFLLALLLGVICYTTLLNLNNYAFLKEPFTLGEEYEYLSKDFVDPIRSILSQGEVNGETWESLKEVWIKFASFLPFYDDKAIASNSEYAIALEYPKVTRWIAQRNVLEFEKLQNWMLWIVELFILIMVAWRRTFCAIQDSYTKAYSKRMRQSEILRSTPPAKTKTLEAGLEALKLEPSLSSDLQTESRGDMKTQKFVDVTTSKRGNIAISFNKTQDKPTDDPQDKFHQTQNITQRHDIEGMETLGPMAFRKQLDEIPIHEPANPEMEIDETNTQESASLKKEFDSGETRISDLPKMQDNMKTQQFKNLEIPSASPQPNISISYRLDPQKPLGPHISESTNTRYALLLRDYNVSNTEELVRLIAQSGQIPLGKAKLLLKTPSVLKSSLTNLEVQTLTSQFNRVGARLQAITMEQLQAIKNKQSLQALETTAAPAPSDSTPSPRDTEKYAILLQNVDETHKGETLHFLASLTGLPIESLRRALRTPAVAAKNISRQEVDQISKQFKGLNAQINVLTMQELQELVAQKRKT